MALPKQYQRYYKEIKAGEGGEVRVKFFNVPSQYGRIFGMLIQEDEDALIVSQKGQKGHWRDLSYSIRRSLKIPYPIRDFVGYEVIEASFDRKHWEANGEISMQVLPPYSLKFMDTEKAYVSVTLSGVSSSRAKLFQLFVKEGLESRAGEDLGKNELPPSLRHELGKRYSQRFTKFTVLEVDIDDDKEIVSGTIRLFSEPKQLELPIQRADVRLLGFIPDSTAHTLSHTTRTLLLSLWGGHHERLVQVLKEEHSLGKTEAEIYMALESMLAIIERRIGGVTAEDTTNSTPQALAELRRELAGDNIPAETLGKLGDIEERVISPFAKLGTFSHRALNVLTRFFSVFSAKDLRLLKSLWETFRIVAITPTEWIGRSKIATESASTMQSILRDVIFSSEDEPTSTIPFLVLSNGDPALDYCSQLAVASWVAYLIYLNPAKKGNYFFNVPLTPPGVYGRRVADCVIGIGERGFDAFPSNPLSADILESHENIMIQDFKLTISSVVKQCRPSLDRYVSDMLDYLARTLMTFFIKHRDTNLSSFGEFSSKVEGEIIGVGPFAKPTKKVIKPTPEQMFSIVGADATRLARYLDKSELRQAALLLNGFLKGRGLPVALDEKTTTFRDKDEESLRRWFKMLGYKG